MAIESTVEKPETVYSTPTKIRVAIIGAGIGGLTLATALSAFDQAHRLDVNIYEGAHQISEVGAGIGMWPRTWKIMKALQLSDPLEHFLDVTPDDNEHIAWKLRKSDQAEGFDIRNIITKGGALMFHRADLQQVLLGGVGAATVHVNKRLVSFDEISDGSLSLQFQDGTTIPCDVLVGMDGIKSVVRKGLFKKLGLSASVKPLWTGTVAYRGLIEQDALEAVFPGHRASTTSMAYVGNLKHIIVYPVRHTDGKVLVNFAAFVTDPSMENTPFSDAPSSPCTKEELICSFSGWDSEVQALVQCIPAPQRWPIGDLAPNPVAPFNETTLKA